MKVFGCVMDVDFSRSAVDECAMAEFHHKFVCDECVMGVE